MIWWLAAFMCAEECEDIEDDELGQMSRKRLQINKKTNICKKRKNVKGDDLMKARFDLFKGLDHEWYINLRGRNGKII